jgi:hypothetical protein
VNSRKDLVTGPIRGFCALHAVILRVDALATRTDWHEKSCASDRAGVRKIARLLQMPVDAFEAIVMLDAGVRDARTAIRLPDRACSIPAPWCCRSCT